MKKLLKTIIIAIFCAFALCTYAFADVAAAPMFITIGLVFLLIAAIVVIAVVIIIKLVMKLYRSRKK